VFLTPLKLAKLAIDMVGDVGGLWLDPFKATGNFYNQYKTDNKEYTEITEGLDFFEYTKPVDVICSNPPFSIFNKVLEHSVKLQPKVISYIMGVVNLTPKRIEFMNSNGYFITKLHITRVNGWFSNILIVQFEKDAKSNIVSFDRERW
jgi:hypothetical protein